jgi:hypothetical protein
LKNDFIWQTIHKVVVSILPHISIDMLDLSKSHF